MFFWKRVTERWQDGSRSVDVFIWDFICDVCDQTRTQAWFAFTGHLSSSEESLSFLVSLVWCFIKGIKGGWQLSPAWDCMRVRMGGTLILLLHHPITLANPPDFTRRLQFFIDLPRFPSGVTILPYFFQFINSYTHLFLLLLFTSCCWHCTSCNPLFCWTLS